MREAIGGFVQEFLGGNQQCNYVSTHSLRVRRRIGNGRYSPEKVSANIPSYG